MSDAKPYTTADELIRASAVMRNVLGLCGTPTPYEAETLDRLLATARENAALREARDKDRERLDFLIDWLGLHDDLEGSGIRDWDDDADALIAIDEALASRAVPPTTESPENG